MDPNKPERTLVEKNGFKACMRCKNERPLLSLYQTFLHGKEVWHCCSADAKWCAAEVERKKGQQS